MLVAVKNAIHRRDEKTSIVNQRILRLIGCVAAVLAMGTGVRAQAPTGEDDVVMRAMVDEVGRAMSGLTLDGLPRPYLIQLWVRERRHLQLAASYGGLTQVDRQHTRMVESRVRVGSYELDNTNFHQPYGYGGALPIDDDYEALRQSIWLVLDRDYKRAVELLAAKQAYLKAKNIEDRPDDFTKIEPVTAVEPRETVAVDKKEWVSKLKRISARFAEHPQIQDAEVTFYAGSATQWLVNTEGTRLRTSDTGALLEIEAELQAADGMLLYDGRTYLGESTDEFPSVESILKDVDAMCAKLVAQAKGERPDQYTGPVLFEAKAAGSVFASLLANRVAAAPVPLGAQWQDPSLERKLNLRILPRSFDVYDDPRPERFGKTLLAGAYDYDDEGVPARRVSIIENGKLENLVASRAPTRKVKGSTGHARNGGFGDPRATAACLYISDEDGVGADELRQEMIEAARDEGLEFALRVESMDDGGHMTLGDPIYAYKVFVEDGREEPVRGLQFEQTSDRAMKRILSGGNERKVHNVLGRMSTSIIAPAVVFEELELSKIEEEFDKLPILPAPGQR